MDIDFRINHVGCNRQEKEDFIINRPSGSSEYLFLHFLCDVNIKIREKNERIGSGACILYEPGVPQLYKAVNGKLKNSYFHFDSSNFGSIAHKFNLPINKVFYARNDDFIEMMIKDMESEFLLKDEYWEESVQGLAVHFFSHLGRYSSQKRNNEMNPSKMELKRKFRMARITILQHPEHDWKLEEMASLLNLCNSRFCIYYKEFFHVSPKADLIAMRISKAKYMLTNEALSVEQIAESLGYNNVFHFIRQFKAMAGCTPGKYWKNKVE